MICTYPNLHCRFDIEDVKSTVKISSIFLVFLENINFNSNNGGRKKYLYSMTVELGWSAIHKNGLGFFG